MTEGQSSSQTLQVLIENFELLSELTDGALDKRSLSRELGVSKKTVYRRCRCLINQNIIQKCPNGYELTTQGHLLTKVCKNVHQSVNQVYSVPCDLLRLLNLYPNSNNIIKDSKVTHASPPLPNQPYEQLKKFLNETSRIWIYTPVITQHLFELLLNRKRNDTSELKLVTTADVKDVIQDHYRDQCKRLVEDSKTVDTGSVNSDNIGFLLTEGKSYCFLHHGEKGNIDALLHSKNSPSYDDVEYLITNELNTKIDHF